MKSKKGAEFGFIISAIIVIVLLFGVSYFFTASSWKGVKGLLGISIDDEDIKTGYTPTDINELCSMRALKLAIDGTANDWTLTKESQSNDQSDTSEEKNLPFDDYELIYHVNLEANEILDNDYQISLFKRFNSEGTQWIYADTFYDNDNGIIQIPSTRSIDIYDFDKFGKNAYVWAQGINDLYNIELKTYKGGELQCNVKTGSGFSGNDIQTWNPNEDRNNDNKKDKDCTDSPTWLQCPGIRVYYCGKTGRKTDISKRIEWNEIDNEAYDFNKVTTEFADTGVMQGHSVETVKYDFNEGFVDIAGKIHSKSALKSYVEFDVDKYKEKVDPSSHLRDDWKTKHIIDRLKWVADPFVDSTTEIGLSCENGVTGVVNLPNGDTTDICDLCVECINGECVVKGFELRQNKGDMSWWDQITALGKPNYLAYYEAFPSEMDIYWQRGRLSVIVAGIGLGTILNTVGAKFGAGKIGKEALEAAFKEGMEKGGKEAGEAAVRKLLKKAGVEAIEEFMEKLHKEGIETFAQKYVFRTLIYKNLGGKMGMKRASFFLDIFDEEIEAVLKRTGKKKLTSKLKKEAISNFGSKVDDIFNSQVLRKELISKYGYHPSLFNSLGLTDALSETAMREMKGSVKEAAEASLKKSLTKAATKEIFEEMSMINGFRRLLIEGGEEGTEVFSK